MLPPHPTQCTPTGLLRVSSHVIPDLVCGASASTCERAAVTKYHQLHGLNIRNVLSPSSGGWKSKIKVAAGLVPSEGSREGLFQACLLTAGTSFCLWQCNSNLYMALCVCLSGSSVPSFYKVTRGNLTSKVNFTSKVTILD